jgi:hypothetical protein
MDTINRTVGFRDLAITPGVAGREPTQAFWHSWIAEFTIGKRVLDVGSGVSTVKEDLLALGTASVTTQDPCDWCPTDLHLPVEALVLAGQTWDVVTCLDVFEHIVDYGRFARSLVALADHSVIITTPGGHITRNVNVNHYHEFLPNEVVQLFEAAGARLHSIRFFQGITPIDATVPKAWKLAATELEVHPLGFVFQV